MWWLHPEIESSYLWAGRHAIIGFACSCMAWVGESGACRPVRAVPILSLSSIAFCKHVRGSTNAGGWSSLCSLHIKVKWNVPTAASVAVSPGRGVIRLDVEAGLGTWVWPWPWPWTWISWHDDIDGCPGSACAPAIISCVAAQPLITVR